MMKHKPGDTVYLFGTQYMGTRFDDNPMGKAKVTTLIDKDEWENEFVAEYVVKIGTKNYRISQNTIDETGTMENKLKVSRKVKSTKKAPKK